MNSWKQTMQAVTVNNLTKAYTPDKNALGGVSFSLAAGDVFGFLGPNGAGKTTAVKLLAGMLTPTAGSCGVFGMDPVEKPEQVHAASGIVTEHAQMYDNMTGMQNLLFFAALFGLTTDTARRRASSLLDQLALTGAKDKKLATYSTGMRQRLSLARAMIHEPKILFLDEPTSGLDPESAKNVNDMIASLARENGTTIFLCTHQLRYAQELCTCYGLVDHGILLAKGTIEELRADVSPGMTVSVRADKIPDKITAYEKPGGTFDIHVSAEDEIPAIVREIVSNGGNVYHVSAHEPTLEEIYFALLERRQQKRAGQ